MNDKKWEDEFISGDQELAKTASDLAQGVTDPKLANTEVSMRLVKCNLLDKIMLRDRI